MFLDTSGLFSFLDAADARHQRAVSLMQSADRMFTHGYVLAELVALGAARRHARRHCLDFVDAIVASNNIEVHWPSKTDFLSAAHLLHTRPDKSYSLCDAMSFIYMRRLSLREALTADHHFEQEGFTRLLPG